MSKIDQVLLAMRFYWNAKTVHSIHSPLVFDLIQHTLESKQHYYAFDEYEYLCEQISEDNTEISFTDLGAGSHKMGSRKRRINQILKHSVSKGQKAQLLFKLVLWQNPNSILELGTCLGLSAWMMSGVSTKIDITTIEGDKNTALYAQNFLKSKPQINVIHADFETALANMSDKKYDLIFIDGHHDGQATQAYVNRLKPMLNDEGLMILDDIYWSRDMNSAWEGIKDDPDFSLSLDLFQFGILIKTKKLKQKEHHIVASRYLKPWRLGFWG